MTAITTFGGLPAHPLFAHVPVVLIPLGAIGAVAMSRPRVRAAIGWWVVAIVFVAGIVTQLTISAGESLEEYVRETELVERHAEMGESIRPWLLLMFLALVGVMLIDRFIVRRPEAAAPLRRVGVAVTAASVLLSGVASFAVFRIGHSGAEAVWADTQQKMDRGERHEEGEGEREGDERGERNEGREGVRPAVAPAASPRG